MSDAKLPCHSFTGLTPGLTLVFHMVVCSDSNKFRRVIHHRPSHPQVKPTVMSSSTLRKSSTPIYVFLVYSEATSSSKRLNPVMLLRRPFSELDNRLPHLVMMALNKTITLVALIVCYFISWIHHDSRRLIQFSSNTDFHEPTNASKEPVKIFQSNTSGCKMRRVGQSGLNSLRTTYRRRRRTSKTVNSKSGNVGRLE
jgi:hypothetical protein